MKTINSLLILLTISFSSFSQSVPEMKEYEDKKFLTFIGKESPKSQGLDFTIIYPSSYKLIDIDHEVMVKGFESEGSASMFFVGVVKKEMSFTTEEKVRLLSQDNMDKAISGSSVDYKYFDYKNTFNIDGHTSSYLEYYAVLNGTACVVREYFIIIDNYLVVLAFAIQKMDGVAMETVKSKFETYKPFFEVVVNSFKVK